jgi:rhodanese-related sulfurtransferase
MIVSCDAIVVLRRNHVRRKSVMKHSEGFVRIVNDARGRIHEVTITDVKERMDRGEKFLLIDVREDHEWDKGHLPRAVHLGRGIIERDIHKITEGPDTEIILYCGGGYRSALAADNLQKMGYRNVKSMDGGFREWKEAGYDLENEP